jgi:hypothetical protein
LVGDGMALGFATRLVRVRIGIQRRLSAREHECVVVAPSLSLSGRATGSRRIVEMPPAQAAPGRRTGRGVGSILQHNVMDGLLELEPCHPAAVQLGPGRPSIVASLAQQKPGERRR